MSADIDPEITEGEIILKDRFLIQSAPDIYRKLEKQVFRLNQSLKKKCCNCSQESSPTPKLKSINSLKFSVLYSPTLTPIHGY